MLSRYRFAAVGCASVVLSALSSSASALPEDGFSANRFEPAARGGSWFQLDSVDIRGPFRLSIGSTLDYSYRPLVLYTRDGAPDYSVVRDRLDLHLGASVVFLERFRGDLSMPFSLVSAGVAGAYGAATYRAPFRSPAQGDLRFGLDGRILGTSDGIARLALGARLWAPTGDPYSYTGDGEIRLSPQLQLAGDYARFSYAARASYLYRGRKVRFGNGTVGNEVGAGLAAGVRFFEKKLLVGPELTWATRASDRSFTRESTPLEILLGAHYTLRERYRVGVGASLGLTEAIGDPTFRTVGSFELLFDQPKGGTAPASAPDRDADGIEDALDACPAAAGRKTTDPRSHGCPDGDDDGIPDIADACPNEKGLPTTTPPGCPDQDGDGIADRKDACSDRPGVANDDPATNGCPAVIDTDHDSVPDEEDACPGVAGPKREGGKSNGSGCPDTDGDGIADSLDACSDKPGPASAVASRNGCPIAELNAEEITIHDQVQFKMASADIDDALGSDQVLQSVLAILESHKELHLRIEGFTDDVGDKEKNLALSTKRAAAVLRWLTAHGIGAKRLSSAGFGPARPIAGNDTSAGRDKNRRVEFRIVK
jgi:OOP family OmpA-OmpF porin